MAEMMDVGRRSLLTGGYAAGTVGALIAGLAPAAAADPTATEPSHGRFYFIRVFEGPDGVSHIQEFDPSQAAEKLPYIYRAKATQVAITMIPAGTFLEWHLTHNNVKRLLVSARALSVIIVNEGDVPGESYYPLDPGAVFLAEDTSGRGHRGKVFAAADAVVFQVDLAD